MRQQCSLIWNTSVLMYARNILGDADFERLIRGNHLMMNQQSMGENPIVNEPITTYGNKPAQGKLF